MDEAEHYFKKAGQAHENYARAYAHLALIAQGKGDEQAARELLRVAVKLDPGDYRSRNNLGNLLDENEARSEYLKALHSVGHRPEVVLGNLQRVSSGGRP